ncbi:uncharacterized protein LOC113295815 isoform X2 [Papaver somniferum]|uniref:uncharacterized protein LOC113295815 isoform X2 n=1 Tax=Papaver somniferum TaxID=3469 RepID=UPI000E7037C7|nr:uncharacterized protein LOC113295815 isoform X2 [Papaver somniferum]
MLKHTTTMGRLSVYNLILLYICASVIGAVSLDQVNMTDSKVLNVGEELQRETLPLQMGSRLYRLNGLESSTWYEVKISYPASRLDQSEKYVLVSVEPAGVVAIPGVKERELVLFDIDAKLFKKMVLAESQVQKSGESKELTEKLSASVEDE